MDAEVMAPSVLSRNLLDVLPGACTSSFSILLGTGKATVVGLACGPTSLLFFEPDTGKKICGAKDPRFEQSSAVYIMKAVHVIMRGTMLGLGCLSVMATYRSVIMRQKRKEAEEEIERKKEAARAAKAATKQTSTLPPSGITPSKT